MNYRGFEEFVNNHTKTYTPTKIKGKYIPEPKFVCSLIVAEAIKDEDYFVMFYKSAPVYILILGDKGKKGKLGFAFYDNKHDFDENGLSNFILNSEDNKVSDIIEIQIRAVEGLDAVLEN